MQKLKLDNAAQLRLALHVELAASAQARQLHRLHCVLLADAGVAGKLVALALGVHPRTVQRWVAAARHGGVAGLMPAAPTGRPAALTVAELARWPSLAPLTGARTGARSGTGARLLRDEILRRTGQAPSLRHCRRLLAGLRQQSG